MSSAVVGFANATQGMAIKSNVVIFVSSSADGDHDLRRFNTTEQPDVHQIAVSFLYNPRQPPR